MVIYDKSGTLQCLRGYYDDQLMLTWWYRLVESIESLLFKRLTKDLSTWPLYSHERMTFHAGVGAYGIHLPPRSKSSVHRQRKRLIGVNFGETVHRGVGELYQRRHRGVFCLLAVVPLCSSKPLEGL